jgi:hypothetical protein
MFGGKKTVGLLTKLQQVYADNRTDDENIRLKVQRYKYLLFFSAFAALATWLREHNMPENDHHQPQTQSR